MPFGLKSSLNTQKEQIEVPMLVNNKL